jgi:hypothetical protein
MKINRIKYPNKILRKKKTSTKIVIKFLATVAFLAFTALTNVAKANLHNITAKETLSKQDFSKLEQGKKAQAGESLEIAKDLISYNNPNKARSNIDFYSEEGRQIIKKSKYNNDFYQLINFFEPQINPAYCGIATAVIILNAINYGKIENQPDLSIHKPLEDGGGIIKFNLNSQINFLNERTDKIKDRKIINYQQPLQSTKKFDPGLSLQDFATILTKIHGLKTRIYFVETFNDKSIDHFRETLKDVLQDETRFLVANFDGYLINNKTSGHISPIAAYDQDSDRLLILDVATHKNKWQWVDLTKFYEAMHSLDGTSYRGFVLITK